MPVIRIAAMPRKDRPVFQWRRVPGKSTSLPSIRVRDFAADVQGEAANTRLNIIDILSRSPTKETSLPAGDFRPGEDCWTLKSSGVRQRLQRRHEQDMQSIDALHQRLEIACNRLTRVSPTSSPNNSPTGGALGTHSVRVQEFDILFGRGRTEGEATVSGAVKPRHTTTPLVPSVSFSNNLGASTRSETAKAHQLSRAPPQARRSRLQTSRWERSKHIESTVVHSNPSELPPSKQEFFSVVGRRDLVNTQSDVTYSTYASDRFTDPEATVSVATGKHLYLEALRHPQVFPEGRRHATFADEGVWADDKEHPLFAPSRGRMMKKTCALALPTLPNAHFLHNTTSKNVHLNGRGLKPKDAYAIAACLKHNNTIETLDLSNNVLFGSEGVHCIADALLLEKHASIGCLCKLDLSRTNCGDYGAECLAEGLGRNNTVTVLKCQHNKLGDKAAQAFATMLSGDNRTLTTLDIGYNNIGVEGAKALGVMFGEASHELKTLYAQWNPLGDDGGAALGEGVLNSQRHSRPSLKHLDLSSCNLSRKTAAVWKSVLNGRQCALVTLSLSHNHRFDEDAAQAFADAIDGNDRLRELKLSFASFGMKGLLQIFKGLARNYGLAALFLEEVCYDAHSDEDLQFIFEASCCMLEEQCMARLRRYRQRSSTMIQLEFPHRHRELNTGLLAIPKYKDMLGLDSDHRFSSGETENRVNQKRTHPEKGRFNRETSVYKIRRKTAESRDFYDTCTVTNRAFELDWKRCVGQKTMTNVFQVSDEEVLKREMDEIRESLKRRYRHIMDVFTSFAAASKVNRACMDYTDFRKFCEITKIVGGNTGPLFLKDVFALTNEEDDPDSVEGKINPDKLLMRYEFLEIILRIAMKKYFQGDPSDAVNEFFAKHFVPYLGEGSMVHDRDDFRRERLYNNDVEAVFAKYKRKLLHFFKKHADRGKHMSFDMFRTFLDSNHLIDEEFSQKQAGLVFQWAQMRTSDEMKNYEFINLITFGEFLECCARIADYKSFPSPDQLKTAGYDTYSAYQTAWKANARLWIGRRPSAGDFHVPKTQPLAYKLGCMFDHWIACNILQ